MLLRRAITADKLGSCIFYGPPGTGKTTLANIIAHTTGANFVQLNAVSSGIADAKEVIDNAKNALKLYGKRTYFMLDECHRWNKAQSDSVLGAIEKGEIIFIGSTTENPFTSMTKAILSRCRIFEFKKLDSKDIERAIKNALQNCSHGYGKMNISISDEAIRHLAYCANGDVRTALNALELAVLSTNPNSKGQIVIDTVTAEQSTQKRSLALDESVFYDTLSAFCKSLRGSSPDASVYYALRLIEAGIDPLIICRRLIVHSAEDVGLADPNALVVATSAMTAFEKIGLPEGKIPLTQAIIYVARAPKSNSVVTTIANAEEALAVQPAPVPLHLCDTHFHLEEVKGYKYPHDYGGYVDQQYLPDTLKDTTIYVKNKNDKEQK